MATRDALILPEADDRSAALTAARDDSLRQLAQSIIRQEPALSVLSPGADGMHGEILDAPSLVIEDHGDIRLFEHSGDEAYSYRSLLLAGDDDLVAIGVERSADFEAYCRDWLGLGSPRLLAPKHSDADASLAVRCRRDRDFVAFAAKHAEACNGLNILPYMGSWAIWRLAAEIAARCRAPLRVVAPPPQLTGRVNDKIWFNQLAQAVCGEVSTPPARRAESFSGLCRQAVELGSAHASIAIKLPDSASSAGNLVLDAAELREMSWQALHDRLELRLLELGWNGSFPLQVMAWEQALVGSPSVQLWIPAPSDGGPLSEAVFDQHNCGLTREFDGARPSQLEQAWLSRIELQAVAIGRVLQFLGYFGRCSLDAIVVGRDDEDAQLHWVECNGRWGGVSLPLSLNRRLGPRQGVAMPFAIFEQAHQQSPRRDLQSTLQSLESSLYRRGRRDQGAVLLSPGRLLDGSGYEFMVRGETLDAALKTGREVTRRLDAA